MSDLPTIEKAERLSRRRARMLPFIAVIYLTQQATFFTGDAAAGSRNVDLVKAGAWLVLSLVMLLAIATHGFWLQRAEVRALIDDDHTRENRAKGMKAGFIAAMLAAIALYVLDRFTLVPAREAIHIVLSAALGAAFLRFAQLERRAH